MYMQLWKYVRTQVCKYVNIQVCKVFNYMNKTSCNLLESYGLWWSGDPVAYAISEPRVVVCQLRWISDNKGSGDV